jgi:GT2 family glycosyltransferase
MKKHPLVYVITLNWNRCEDTVACLTSLGNLTYQNKSLLLVDNGSDDGTPEVVASGFPEVEIIINKQNLGFAAGFNVGIHHAFDQEAEYAFIVNNDTTIEERALSEMMTLVKDDVGLISPKIYFASEPDRIWSVGAMRHPLTIEMTGDAQGEIDTGQWACVIEREYLVGCALLISRRLSDEIGLFDERFFMYYEDSDLSLRARQAGFRLLLSPNSHVLHKVAVSSGGKGSPFERYWMAHSSVLFFRKHAKNWHWVIIIPYRTASAVKTVWKLFRQGSNKAMWAYIRGLRDGILRPTIRENGFDDARANSAKD